MKYIEDAYVTCPFYQKESAARLVCEGITHETGNVTTFKSRMTKNEYKEKYCRNKYGRCILCQALLSKYD